jgi:hypothetical protein
MTYGHGRGAEYWPFAGSIYGVRELGLPEYRYVGLTTQTISRRRSEHWKAADGGKKTPFAHTRHHTNKGVVKVDCRHCQDDLTRQHEGGER